MSTNSGSTHASLSVDDSISYITEVFDDYKHYSKQKQFYGRAAEVGPGDNCGVGLLFLAHGCERVDLVDRFYSRRDNRHQSLIYQKLLRLYPDLKHQCKSYPPVDESAFTGIQRFYGEEASAENFFRSHGPYQIIYSRATLEHVSDPIAALRSMTKSLSRHGMLLHKVDLRDHGMFSKHHHELKFLEIPDLIYKQMIRASGRPNRVLVNQYRSALLEDELQYSILVTRLAGVGDIVPHRLYENIVQVQRDESLHYVRSLRHRFARSLAGISDEDVSITGFFLVAEKSK